MAVNIIDYVKEYQYTFNEKPFNLVDALILNQVSYWKMDDLAPKLPPRNPECTPEFAPFRKIAMHTNDARLFSDPRFRDNNMKLRDALLFSKRFRDMKVGLYLNVFDKVLEIQFAAMTFQLPQELCYVAFRGTDESLVGWKEDMTLAFSEPVLGQMYASGYFLRVVDYLPDRFYMGGHSKGGNLAIFAAMSAPLRLQERLLQVFSHDGPGFKSEIRERYHYEILEPIITRVLPEQSLVGMLMDLGDDYLVAKNFALGLGQHDPFNWQVKNGDFVYADHLNRGALALDNTLNEWIRNLNDDQIRIVTDFLFDTLGASQADNLIDLSHAWKHMFLEAFLRVAEGGKEKKKSGEFCRKNYVSGIKKMAQKSILEIAESDPYAIQEKIRAEKEQLKKFRDNMKTLIDNMKKGE